MSSSSISASPYAGGARALNSSTPSPSSRVTASATREDSVPSASASRSRAAAAASFRRGEAATTGLRLPNAMEWSITRTLPDGPISCARAPREVSIPSGLRASVFRARKPFPRLRMRSNSFSIRSIAPLRSRWTTHTLSPAEESFFAVARPKPLEPPRIRAHSFLSNVRIISASAR